MSERQADLVHLAQLAALRRKAKATLKAHQLKVIADHLRDGYESKEIARRLGIGIDVARDLISEVKRNQRDSEAVGLGRPGDLEDLADDIGPLDCSHPWSKGRSGGRS